MHTSVEQLKKMYMCRNISLFDTRLKNPTDLRKFWGWNYNGAVHPSHNFVQLSPQQTTWSSKFMDAIK
jgi:hypothetical protein